MSHAATRVLYAVAAAAVMAGAFLSVGPPHLILVNAGLQITYPWLRPGGALLTALGCAVLAWRLATRWARVALGAFAALSLLASAHLLLYRVRTDPAGISTRGMLGPGRIAWPELQGVQSGPGLLLLTGAGGQRLRIDTTDYRPQDRATLDRTIARHLSEVTSGSSAP